MNWKELLGLEYKSIYLQELLSKLDREISQGKVILPDKKLWFRALQLTAFDEVKAVIIGQDPYPNSSHAHGLCFSVPDGVAPPGSLLNILKNLEIDLGIKSTTGNLTNWANNGVLLLNSCLTVEQGFPRSHKGWGWERLISKIITYISQYKSEIVFFLWGKEAFEYRLLIDQDKHLVLHSAHPSPLSAHRGFINNKHFYQANTYLGKYNKNINWNL